MGNVGFRLQAAGLGLLVVFLIVLAMAYSGAATYDSRRDILEADRAIERMKAERLGRDASHLKAPLPATGEEQYETQRMVGYIGSALGGLLVIIGWTMVGKREE